jgi:hypothetical protein
VRTPGPPAFVSAARRREAQPARLPTGSADATGRTATGAALGSRTAGLGTTVTSCAVRSPGFVGDGSSVNSRMTSRLGSSAVLTLQAAQGGAGAWQEERLRDA